uniref:Uncharacterized protein n=1 Tax=Oryza glumipatula TaxID=40148 RepID=A0A0E0BPN0_9ORYZ
MATANNPGPLDLVPGFSPEDMDNPIHNAALSYVSYDRYVLDTSEVYFDDCIPLESYLNIRPMVTSDSYQFRSFGETNPSVTYLVATESCKKVIRTMLKGLRTNELRNLCFLDLSISNIFVSPTGKVKFKNISRVKLEMDLLRNNYLSAHQIIRNLFLSEDGSVPEDIQHLLNLILHEFDKRDISFSWSMYDHIRFVMPPDDLRAILTNLPYADVWESKVKTNRILKKPYDFNPDGRIVPADKPSQTCLNKRQREFLHALGLTPIRGQKSLTPDQIALIETLFFFDFLRNRTSHRMDPWRSLILGYNAVDSDGSPYQAIAGHDATSMQEDLLARECWLEESGKKVVKYKMPNVVIKQMMSYPYTYPEYAYTEEELAQRSASNRQLLKLRKFIDEKMNAYEQNLIDQYLKHGYAFDEEHK